MSGNMHAEYFGLIVAVALLFVTHSRGQADFQFDNWENWSPCTVTCGNGVESRSRVCKFGNCVQTEEKTCWRTCFKEPVTNFDPWSEWSVCSAGCGPGEAKRTRTRPDGLGVEEETKYCNNAICRSRAVPNNSQWTDWSACSTTCGPGQAKRTRLSPDGISVEEQSKLCYLTICLSRATPNNGQWTDWSECSTTCGPGEAKRTRLSPDGFSVEEQFKRCNLAVCQSRAVPTNGPWTDWSECSTTCGPGEAKRTRQYLDGISSQEQIKYCNNGRCQSSDNYQPWMRWSQCTVSCGTGIETRVRFCKLGSCHDTQTRPCNPKECIPAVVYTDWEEWGGCSVTCGSGISTRKRFCTVGTCEEKEQRECDMEKCETYTEWEEWSECSVTCGSGISTRKRFCMVGTCEKKEQKTCDKEKCESGWEDWSKWHGCHKSCGGGFDYRLRSCKEELPSENCPGSNLEYNRCNTQSCTAAGVWGPWSEWETCQVTCGSGTSLRIRICQNGECIGDEKERRPCSTTECVKAHLSKWSEWSTCSVTCGKGQKTRSRTCIGGKQWDEGCLGSLLMKNVCEKPPCMKAKWSKWSPWHPCSVTCGKGTRSRERKCIGGEINDIGCTGKASGTRNCHKSACITEVWGPWSEWGKCQVSCGTGTSARIRVCEEGECKGEDKETRSCTVQECVEDTNVRCPDVVRPYNSDVVSSASAPYKVGAKMTFTCDTGYLARGQKMIVCQRDGRWSGSSPYCAPITCERDLRRVAEGHICHEECSSDDDCLELSAKCLCDEWCGRSCFDPDTECEPLSVPENGYIVGHVRTYGHTVTYVCSDGFILIGIPTRTCRSDGRWTGRSAHCYSYSTPGLAGDIGNLLRKGSVQRVIRGDDARIGAWPWQALFMYNMRNSLDASLKAMLAGGSVINKRWILTAAHVVHPHVRRNWKTFVVIGLGITRIPKENQTLPHYVQLYQPDIYVNHEKFDPGNYDYDVCLIRIGKRLIVKNNVFVVDDDANHGEIVFDQYVRPVALPCISACDVEEKKLNENGIDVKPFEQASCTEYGTRLKSLEDEGVVVTGYGDTSKNTVQEQTIDVPEILQQALLKLLKPVECVNGVRRIVQEYRLARYTGRMMCAGSNAGKDACQGDSGGPLLKEITAKDGHKCWVQVGIISWGWGCGNTDKQNVPYPGYYADTSVLMPWIVEHMKKNQ